MVGDAHSVFKVYGKDDVIRAFDQRCKGRFRKVAIFPYFSIPAVLYVIGFASAKDNTISALIFGAIESLVGSCKQVFYALVPLARVKYHCTYTAGDFELHSLRAHGKIRD
jgi:hypothetical protein